jgi:hypothetical protein
MLIIKTKFLKIVDGENAGMEFIITMKSVLRQFHNLFQSEISIQSEMMFRLSI